MSCNLSNIYIIAHQLVYMCPSTQILIRVHPPGCAIGLHGEQYVGRSKIKSNFEFVTICMHVADNIKFWICDQQKMSNFEFKL